MQRIYSSGDLEGIAIDEGWRFVRQKGSHRQFKKEGVPYVVTIPANRDAIPVGTCRKLLKQIRGTAKLTKRS